METELCGIVYKELEGETKLPRVELLAWLSVAATEIGRLNAKVSRMANAGAIDPPRDPVAVAEVAKARAALEAGPAPAKHRHEFNTDGLCGVVLSDGRVCGEKKKANGRPRKVVEVPPAAPAGDDFGVKTTVPVLR